ncbi:hypothetical protein EV426DRAFT_594092 [Tirmania nivea]|nr:hypothetical protein EV426DRAFT_594092 [Tirmania nivea]
MSAATPSPSPSSSSFSGAEDRDRPVTRIFVSLESDQATRYWIPISAIPTWQEFVTILASIFHNNSPPVLYYVSDRRNVIHESVWQYREFLTQNGIFHVEFERPNQDSATQARDEVVVTVQDGVEAVRRREGVVLDDSGQPLTLPPPPPYSVVGEAAPQQGGAAARPGGVVNNVNSNSQPSRGAARSTHDTPSPSLSFALPFLNIFSLHLLIQTPHNLSPSNVTPNFTFSQHLIVNPSVAVSHIREIAKRLYLKKHPSVARLQTTYTLLHRRFGPNRRVFPMRFDEMEDGKTLGDYGCIDEDSRVEVNIQSESAGDNPSPTLSERAAEWIRQIRNPMGTRSTGPPQGELTAREEYEMEVDEPEDTMEDVPELVRCHACDGHCASLGLQYADYTDPIASLHEGPVVVKDSPPNEEEVL